MGCDIHAMIEVRVDPYGLEPELHEHAGWWACAGEVFIDRNYELFAKFADVRNWGESPIEPITRPRGIPRDVSDAAGAWIERWGIDGHSHSWLDLADLDPVNDPNIKKEVNRIVRQMEALKKLHKGSDVRLVFFFDN